MALFGVLAVRADARSEASLAFDTQDVVMVEVQRAGRTEQHGGAPDPDAPVLTLTNRVVIDYGLTTLQTATRFHGSHEYGVDGFLLSLHTDGNGEPDAYLTVYRDTSRRGGQHLVVPQSAAREGGGVRGKRYRCDAFHEWFDEIVRPLYRDLLHEQRAAGQHSATQRNQ